MEFFLTHNEIESLIDLTATRPFICAAIALAIAALFAVCIWGDRYVKNIA